MVSHALKVTLLACAFAVAGSGLAGAQQAGPDAAPRCGGLFCDMGLIGGPPDRTTLPCNDFFCRAFGGGRTAEAPPPAPVAAVEPEPMKPMKARHKRMAKVSRAKAKTEAKDAKEGSAGEPKADAAGR